MISLILKTSLNPGIQLLIKALVEEWETKDGRKGISLRIKSMHMLSEARNELIKSSQTKP